MRERESTMVHVKALITAQSHTYRKFQIDIGTLIRTNGTEQ